MENKIFIDCGGHCGCSIRKFTKELDPKNEYKRYSFECNPMLFPYYSDVNTTLIKKAVWTKNETKKFYISTGNRLSGSSISTNKTSGNLSENNSIDIECVDFSDWTKQFKNAIIVMKMDIEGVEYDVLEKMIADGTIFKINELYIEFHSKKMRGNYKEREQEIQKYLKSIKIYTRDWNALNYCKCKKEDFSE